MIERRCWERWGRKGVREIEYVELVLEEPSCSAVYTEAWLARCARTLGEGGAKVDAPWGSK